MNNRSLAPALTAGLVCFLPQNTCTTWRLRSAATDDEPPRPWNRNRRTVGDQRVESSPPPLLVLKNTIFSLTCEYEYSYLKV